MADDLVALRAEYVAARASLVPIIDGLDDLDDMPRFTARARQFLTDVFRLRGHRRDLIDRTIAAIDALTVARNALAQDGYPNVPPIEVPRDVADELEAEKQRLLAGFGQLEPKPQASTMTVTLGAPADKA